MRLYLNILGTLRRSLLPLLAFEALFKVVSVVLLAPLSAAILAALIATTGKASLSNFEIVSFLLSPEGLLALVCLGGLSFTVLLVEQAGILLLVSAPALPGKVTFLGVLLRLAFRLPRLLLLGLIQFATYLAAVAPFVASAWLTYRALLAEHDINYYVDARPVEFWVAIGIGGVLALACALVILMLFVRWLFSLPLALLRHQGAWSALRNSSRLTRGGLWGIVGRLLIWFLLALAVALCAGLLLETLSEYALQLAGDRYRVVIPTVAGLLALHLLAGWIGSFFLFTGTCLLVLRLYERACERFAEPALAESKPMPDRAMTPPQRWSWRTIIWVGVLVFAVVSVTSALALVENVAMPDRIEITAHRGASRVAPENSLSAVRAAIDAGADVAEIDVQLTADGEVVVLHDEDLKRVAGVSKKIAAITAAELKDIDAGSRFGTKFKGERIPTLEEVIDVAGDRIRLNIELKYYGKNDALAGRVVDIVMRRNFATRCVITSMQYEPLLAVKKLNPQLQTGEIVAQAVGQLVGRHVDFFSVSAGMVDRELVGRIHSAGKKLHVWTVNRREEMQAMIGLGVDNLITDEPALARELLEERQGLTNVDRLLLAFHQRLKEQ